MIKGERLILLYIKIEVQEQTEGCKRMPRQPRIYYILSEENLGKLKALAESEGRSLSNLTGRFVEAALIQSSIPAVEPGQLDQTEEVIRFLRKLAQSDRPSDSDCILAAHDAGIQEEDLIQLRDRLFTKEKNGNGIAH
jgi:hypothetical protein